MSGEYPSHAAPGTLQLPPADISDPVWIRYQNRTFMNKGSGPYSFMNADLAKYVPAGDANWANMFGKEKGNWTFNTVCCATQKYYQMAVCKKY